MAYRQFRNEKYYEAPDLQPAFEGVNQAVTNVFSQLRKKQEDRRKVADQFAYDLDKGKYENDTKILTELSKNVIARAKDEIDKNGRVSLETRQLMQDGLGWQQMSVNQFERAKQLRQGVIDRGVRDKWYKADEALKIIDEAPYGPDNDRNFTTRDEALNEASKKIDSIDFFNFQGYRANYVKEVGSQYKDTETPLKTGGSITRYNQATFWDDSKGVPGVTNKHAIQFLDSDKRVNEYYDDKISKQLQGEIKSMRASSDRRVDWMSGLSDAEVANELVNHPEKNLINSQTFGERKLNSAKEDLNEADRINSKISYTGLEDDKNNSGGRWTNPNILHDNAINSFAQQSKSISTGVMAPVTTYGPGGRFTQKSGRPIQIDTLNPIRTDINSGVTTRNNKGSLRFNMTGYQLMPVKKGYAPFVLQSSTPEGMIEEINKMPLETFEGLQPEMKIGLNGYTINEAGVLNDIQDQMVDIASQISTARKTGNIEELAKLENMEYSLNELKEMIGSGDYDQQDLIIAGNKAGVRKIQQNWIIPADDSDIATIKNVTGGFNLKDRSYWSPDMVAVDEAYKRRYTQAQEEKFGKKEEEGVISSDGSDVDKWVTTSSYKVGNNIYFFDKASNTWKKKTKS